MYIVILTRGCSPRKPVSVINTTGCDSTKPTCLHFPRTFTGTGHHNKCGAMLRLELLSWGGLISLIHTSKPCYTYYIYKYIYYTYIYIIPTHTHMHISTHIIHTYTQHTLLHPPTIIIWNTFCSCIFKEFWLTQITLTPQMIHTFSAVFCLNTQLL